MGPIFGRDYFQCKSMVILRDFPYASVIVWVGNIMPPVRRISQGVNWVFSMGPSWGGSNKQ